MLHIILFNIHTANATHSRGSSPSIPAPDSHAEVTYLPHLRALRLFFLQLLLTALLWRGCHLKEVTCNVYHILQILLQLEQLLITGVIRESGLYLRTARGHGHTPIVRTATWHVLNTDTYSTRHQ